MTIMSRIRAAVDAFQGRAPAQAAALPVDRGIRLLGGATSMVPRRDTRELLAAFGQSPMLYALLMKIASAVARTEWRVEARLEDGWNEVPSHALAELLNGPVHGLNGFQAKQVTEVQQLIAGEAFWVLDRDVLGMPVRRWPVPPHWVMQAPLPGDDMFRMTAYHGGSSIEVRRRDVVWHKTPDPYDPYGRGTGYGRALADEISADEAAAKMMASSFANHMMPDAIVSGTKEAPLDDESVQRIQEIWRGRFQGADRAGGAFFAKAPIEVTTLTPGLREMQFREMREFERDYMISVLGVPPEMVGVLQNSNRATIESAEFLFTKHVVLPIVEQRANTIDDQLTWQFADGLRVAYDSPIDEDRDFALQVITSRPTAFSHDEVRDLAEYEPLPDGAGEARPDDLSSLLAGGSMFGGGNAPAPGAAAEPDTTPAEQEDAIRAAFQTRGIGDVFAGLADDMFSDILARAMGPAAFVFARSTLDEIGVVIDFGVFDARVFETIRTIAAERSRLIVGTTRDALRVTLSEGVRDGEATDKLVQRIQTVITGASVARAKMISRTEIVRASNLGAQESLVEAGIEARQWLATFDDHVRDTHRRLDKQVRPIDSPFTIDGAAGMYPGDFGRPGLDINCRCAVIPVIDGLETRDARAGYWKVYDSRRRRFEQELEVALIAAFGEQERLVIEALQL